LKDSEKKYQELLDEKSKSPRFADLKKVSTMGIMPTKKEPTPTAPPPPPPDDGIPEFLDPEDLMDKEERRMNKALTKRQTNHTKPRSNSIVNSTDMHSPRRSNRSSLILPNDMPEWKKKQLQQEQAQAQKAEMEAQKKIRKP